MALHAHSFVRAPLRGSCWSQAPAPTKLRRLPVPSFAWHQPHAAGYRIGQECELEQPCEGAFAVEDATTKALSTTPPDPVWRTLAPSTESAKVHEERSEECGDLVVGGRAGLQALEQKLVLSEADRSLLCQEMDVLLRTLEEHGVVDPRGTAVRGHPQNTPLTRTGGRLRCRIRAVEGAAPPQPAGEPYVISKHPLLRAPRESCEERRGGLKLHCGLWRTVRAEYRLSEWALCRQGLPW